MMQGRKYLGREFIPFVGFLTGFRLVFEVEDALEIDENNFVTIERTRVYFDDVLGITYHREPGLIFLIVSAICALFFGILAEILAVDRQIPGAIALACCAVPFLIGFILRLILKVDVITVFGKRTMARMKFPMRKGRARQIYRDLTLKIRSCQAKAAPPLPAPPEVPLPPPPAAP